MKQLQQTLHRIDGRGYKAYKDLQGLRYDFADFRLAVDHVQGDPFAAPSRLRARVGLQRAGLPPAATTTPARSRATRDFLARCFRRAASGHRDLCIDAGAQTVLERSACLLVDDCIELRFTVDLPASGRRILGRAAATLLCDRLPEIVLRATCSEHLDLDALQRWGAVVEDQVALREQLHGRGLAAFVADGSVLARRSGVDDRPLADAVPFISPDSLAVELEAPNTGVVRGLGLRQGITLVVGGGYHGKSTLLRAVEVGIYDHLPGDGRELVVCESSAAKIRAEDGRAVSGVRISEFIDNLPFGQGTSAFTTDLASGSTSQAAGLVEALETGAGTLLVDEDTSASNFMIRDRRMQALVAKSCEPITPLVDRIRELRDSLGVSTILVMGGSGDYFDHADTVIQMNAYEPEDVTSEAHELAAQLATGRVEEHDSALQAPRPRSLDPRSLDPNRRPGRRKIQARGRNTLVFGCGDVDLRAVEQIADPSQVRAIGYLLAILSEQQRSFEAVAEIRLRLQALAEGGWDDLNGRPDGDLALPRLHEVMAALNRIRGARLS